MKVGAEASLIQYLMYLNGVGHPEIDQTDVPSALCDLYPENSSYLGKRSPTVHIERAVYMNTTLYITAMTVIGCWRSRTLVRLCSVFAPVLIHYRS